MPCLKSLFAMYICMCVYSTNRNTKGWIHSLIEWAQAQRWWWWSRAYEAALLRGRGYGIGGDGDEEEGRWTRPFHNGATAITAPWSPTISGFVTSWTSCTHTKPFFALYKRVPRQSRTSAQSCTMGRKDRQLCCQMKLMVAVGVLIIFLPSWLFAPGGSFTRVVPSLPPIWA